MKYISVCSGIEAASVAWHELGWEPVAFSEIEPFPSEVLKIRFPHVPNWGDMTKFDSWPNVEVNLLVGGTPCQSFSVAGLRQGLKDPRGNLMLTFLAIADKYRPQWIVWENVPGVLSSNGGKDFESFLDGLEAIGYICDVEILDAQNFGVAQRRRRVFVCGQSVESILEQRTVLSALTISQCLVEILHGILIEVLYLYEREPLKLGLAHLSKDGVSRRMSLFGLLTEDCNYGKWQKLLVDVFQKHQPEQNIWDLPSGGKTERELTVEDLLMGLNQEGQSTLTEGSLNEALEELYDLMRLFTTSTLTREIIQSKISLFFKVGESIGRLICRLSGSSPNSSSAILSFLTLQTELTNYARKTGGNLFSEMEGFYPYDDFIRKAERTSAIIGNFGDRGTAVQVLFESESVSRNPAPSREKRQAVAPSPASGVGVGGEWWDGGQTASTVTTRSGGQYMPDKDNFGAVLTVNTKQFLDIQENVTGTLLATDHKEPQMVAHGFLPTQGSKAHGLGIEKELSPTLRSGCDSYGVYTQPIALAENTIGRQPENGGNGDGFTENGPMYTLNATGVHGVAQPISWDTECNANVNMMGTLTRGGEGGRTDGVAQPITIDRSSVNMGYDFNRDLGIEQSGVTPTILATGPHSVAHAFKIRGGSPTETGEYGGTPGKAAGKGYLGSDELAFTIAASQDQQIAYRKVRMAQSADDFETWKRDEVINTLNCFDQGDVRAVNVVLTSFGFLPTQGSKAHGLGIEQELSPTLRSGCDAYGVYQEPVAVDVYNQAIDGQVAATITEAVGGTNTSGAKVMMPVISVDTFNQTVNEHTSQTLGSSATDVNHYGAVMMPNISPTITQCKGSRGGSSMEAIDEIKAIYAQQPMAIRRLTPLECERLQGFPDNWTLIPWKNKPIEDCPDGPRYKACGNSMAVPCMRWIGQRINDAKAELF